MSTQKRPGRGEDHNGGEETRAVGGTTVKEKEKAVGNTQGKTGKKATPVGEVSAKIKRDPPRVAAEPSPARGPAECLKRKGNGEGREEAMNVMGEAETKSVEDVALTRASFPQSLPEGPDYRELGRKGGVASGAARRRRRELRETACELLSLECVHPGGLDALQALGQAEGDNTAAILAAILSAAMRGSLDAAKFIRDLTAPKATPEDHTVEFCFDRFEDITG